MSNKTGNDKLFGSKESYILYPFFLMMIIVGGLNIYNKFYPWAMEVWHAFTSNGAQNVNSPAPFEHFLLPMVAFIGIYIIHERNSLIAKISDKQQGVSEDITSSLFALSEQFNQNTKLVINSLGGVEFKSFSSDLDLKRYLNDVVKSATREVTDFTWAHNKYANTPRRLPDEQLEWERLENEFDDIVAQVSVKKIYREIFILSRESRINKLKRRYKEKSAGYFCRALDESHIPRMQFVTIDGAEAIFISGNHRVLCSIRHRQLVRLLVDYFEEVWNVARPLVISQDGKAVWDTDAYIKELKENVNASKANAISEI